MRDSSQWRARLRSPGVVACSASRSTTCSWIARFRSLHAQLASRRVRWCPREAPMASLRWTSPARLRIPRLIAWHARLATAGTWGPAAGEDDAQLPRRTSSRRSTSLTKKLWAMNRPTATRATSRTRSMPMARRRVRLALSARRHSSTRSASASPLLVSVAADRVRERVHFHTRICPCVLCELVFVLRR